MTGGRPLRVLVYEPYPLEKTAGNIRTLTGILQHAPAAQVHCLVVAPFDTPLGARVQALGADWTVAAAPAAVNQYGGKLPGASMTGKVHAVTSLFVYSFRLRRILRSEHIELVYCNSIRALMTIGFAALTAGVPRVWYVKGELQNPWLDRIGFLLASRILFFCESNRSDRYPLLVRLSRRKIDLVNIGVDLDEIARAHSGPSSIDDEMARRGGVGVGYLGQLMPGKGVHVLLEAFARIAPLFTDATLYLFGDAMIVEFEPYVDELRQLAGRLGIADRVVFAGWRDDAFAVANRMTVMVHPSFSEGFGLAVLEPMAMGKPVIATRVGGLREAIRDGVNGFLVEPGDADAIARRLEMLLSNPALRQRLGRQARATVEREYALHDKMSRLFAIWHRMVNRAGPSPAATEARRPV